MQRPTPLPASTPGSRPAANPEQEIAFTPIGPPITAPETRAIDPDGTAPMESLWHDVPEDAVRPVPLAPAVEPAPGVDPEVGVRDVWAAARARRRALRAEVRRFTARQRRRRMLWIGIASAFMLLVLGTLGAAYSPLFAVERVQVVGTSSLDPGAVEAALSGQIGVPLSLVDSSEVKAALVQFPLVETYTLEARPPHDLVVRIVERTPIGSVQSAAGYTLVDAAGVALSTTAEPPAGHPVIEVTGGVGSPAFEAVGTVFRALPDSIRAQVTGMTATTANDVTLSLGGPGTSVVWGNADDSEYKAIALETIMAARPPEGVYSYDVSAPDAVVVR
ncbi:FtsQ-type POTRA domain-containing protein [Microbacterium memoriense]|uniref:FtsQ-type POTRA domain-containing protein n=1 Tax=Microbacterium memoriense TaxID=2978350 RepID=A0ABT2PBF9_9MICO|nr:FtsQ-type POTRA domain-containing protein [Microbacterium memoriense]MCT9001124.1 FtsQ-type POTRA domain-containing protein [Microbacterium memoriense]